LQCSHTSAELGKDHTWQVPYDATRSRDLVRVLDQDGCFELEAEAHKTRAAFAIHRLDRRPCALRRPRPQCPRGGSRPEPTAPSNKPYVQSCAARMEAASAFKDANFCFLRLRTSPASHKWQCLQFKPLLQPCGRQNHAQGLQSPDSCAREPSDISDWRCSTEAAFERIKVA